MTTSTRKVSLPLGNSDVEDLLMWRDPKKSGLVFAAVTLGYILLEWSHYSLLTIIANVLLIAVTISFLWNNIASFTGRPGVPVPAVFKHGVSEADVKSTTERVAVYFNKTLAFANRVITGKDVVLSAQVAAALFLIGKIGGWFTSLGLLYTVVVIAFTVPKLYELRKEEIDGAFHKVHKESKVHYSKYVEPYVNKIPRGSTSTSTARVIPPEATTDSASSVEVKKTI